MPRAFVSLTTHAKRAPFVGAAVQSLVRQAEATGCRVCLAIESGAATLLPGDVRALADAGRLELLAESRDLGVNMKWIPARRAHTDAPIVCLDDDRIYPDCMLPEFLAAYERFPNAIVCRAERRLVVDDTGHTARYTLVEGPTKARLRTCRKVTAPELLEPGRHIFEHWAGVLHPPHFGEADFAEAVDRAPHDDDTFLSVLAGRRGVPVYIVQSNGPPCLVDLAATGDQTASAIRATALGNQRMKGYGRTAEVLASYEAELLSQRALRVLWATGATGEPHETILRYTLPLMRKFCGADNVLSGTGKSVEDRVWTRLALDTGVRRDYDRLVWVDADVEILSADFALFGQIDAGDKEVWGVRDPGGEMRKIGCKSVARASKGANAPRNRPYINGGLVGFDLRRIDPDALRRDLDEWGGVPFVGIDQDLLHILREPALASPRFNVFWEERDKHPDALAIHYTGPRSGPEAKKALLRAARFAEYA